MSNVKWDKEQWIWLLDMRYENHISDSSIDYGLDHKDCKEIAELLKNSVLLDDVKELKEAWEYIMTFLPKGQLSDKHLFIEKWFKDHGLAETRTATVKDSGPYTPKSLPSRSRSAAVSGGRAAEKVKRQ